MRPRYVESIISARKLRDSHAVELVLLWLAYLSTYRVMTGVTQSGSTWFRPGSELTTAGYFYALISLPIWMFWLLPSGARFRKALCEG